MYVVEAFNVIVDHKVIPPKANAVLDFIEDTWIGRPHRRGRRTFWFPLKKWNCYHAALETMPKTNISVGGWHTDFEPTLDA